MKRRILVHERWCVGDRRPADKTGHPDEIRRPVPTIPAESAPV